MASGGTKLARMLYMMIWFTECMHSVLKDIIAPKEFSLKNAIKYKISSNTEIWWFERTTSVITCYGFTIYSILLHVIRLLYIKYQLLECHINQVKVKRSKRVQFYRVLYQIKATESHNCNM
ncbi:hypothetical protein GQX74_000327 [Glossina fuscipes]|nr:hypothetical protein GQX74_000327 [Glossina fuscipes]